MTFADEQARQARAALTALAQPGDPEVGRSIAEFGASMTLTSMLDRDSALRARAMRLWGQGSPLEALGTGESRLVIPGDAEWPTQVDDLGDIAPFALWVIGEADLRLTALRSVAIVGARAATAYGERVARQWAAELAERQWTVISGGAIGVDAAAHRGALDAGGVTGCVLACGPDVAYPASHAGLLARIADQGVLVSEAPPGTPARRHRFLSRNRLIAALSRLTVVVEAATRSGTTATANAACLVQRPVVAVPGPVVSMMSAGCHRLIREGMAVLATNVEEILELLPSPGQAASPVETPGLASNTRRRSDGLAPDVLRVFDALPSRTAVPVDGILAETGLSPRVIASALGELVTRGLAVSSGHGWIVATDRTARPQQ